MTASGVDYAALAPADDHTLPVPAGALERRMPVPSEAGSTSSDWSMASGVDYASFAPAAHSTLNAENQTPPDADNVTQTTYTHIA